MIPAQQHPNYYHNRSNQTISKEPIIQKQSQVSHIKSMQITRDAAQLATQEHKLNTRTISLKEKEQ